MGSSKDGDSNDGPKLTLVGGHLAEGESDPPEGVDKATLAKLSELKNQHRELDEEIHALVSSVTSDQLLLKRLKLSVRLWNRSKKPAFLVSQRSDSGFPLPSPFLGGSFVTLVSTLG